MAHEDEVIELLKEIRDNQKASMEAFRAYESRHFIRWSVLLLAVFLVVWKVLMINH